MLQPLRQHELDLITRVRISTVARAPFCPLPEPRGRGRPRKWGGEVPLRELFALLEDCTQAAVWLYGRYLKVCYQCFELH